MEEEGRSARVSMAIKSEVIHAARVGLVYQSRTGRIPALDDVTLTAKKEEFVALLGPSGCGKSTMMKIVAGLLRPTSGRIWLNGGEVQGPAKDVGIVFQSPLLMPWRTVLDNILLQIEIRGLRVSDYREPAQELVKLVGLESFERRYPWELSGGMQQRVGLCRSLIHDPTLLLMDEPFGALDAMTREQMTAELQRIWLDRRKTVLFITHSISEAVFLADRVLVMSNRPGRIIGEVMVPVPRPRKIENIGSSTFSSLTGKVREFLSGSAT